MVPKHDFNSKMHNGENAFEVLLYLPIIELAMWRVCMYVSHVLDRKLLERLMSPSPKSQVMFAPAFS